LTSNVLRIVKGNTCLDVMNDYVISEDIRIIHCKRQNKFTHKWTQCLKRLTGENLSVSELNCVPWKRRR